MNMSGGASLFFPIPGHFIDTLFWCASMQMDCTDKEFVGSIHGHAIIFYDERWIEAVEFCAQKNFPFILYRPALQDLDEAVILHSATSL